MIETIQDLIIAGVVILQLLAVFLIIVMIIKKQSILNFVHKHVLLLGFALVAGATLGSLFYSVVVGLQPCLLCWWQRIALFPQVVVLGLAVLKKDLNARLYALWLSIFGGAIALYHYYTQITYNPLIPCPVEPGGISCVEKQVFELGYITIPVMSLAVFLLIVLVMWISLRATARQDQA